MKLWENNVLIKLLEEYPLARDDRAFAYSIVCKKREEEKEIDHKKFLIFLEVLQDMPKESDIIRQIAYIQNNMGLYPPSKWCRLARKNKEEKKREEYKRDNWFLHNLFNIFSKND